MKLILTVIATVVCSSLFASNSEKAKCALDTVPAPYELPVAKASIPKIESDTIVITGNKVIKIGKFYYNTQHLNQRVTLVPDEERNKLLDALQEYPAKCANPITEILLKFFGMK